MAYTGKKPIDHTDVTQSQSMTVTDDLTVDGTTLHVDSTNNRVGVGNVSPAKELDVTGAIRASTGVLFGSDTAAANTLDDYEEGTWTPSASTNVSAIADEEGFYTKIGNIVVLLFKANLTPTATTGGMRIAGLPFPVADKVTGTQVEGTGVIFEDSSTFMMFPLGNTSSFQIEFDRPIQGSASSSVKMYRGNVTYFTT